MQQYCETLFNLSYCGPLKIHQHQTVNNDNLFGQTITVVKCAVCMTELITAHTFEVVVYTISLRVSGGDLCELCAHLIMSMVTRRHESRMRSIDNFMKRHKIEITRSLDRVTRYKPNYRAFESTAKAEVRKWNSYYRSVRSALSPHFKSLPFYLTFKVTQIRPRARLCRVCDHRMQDHAVYIVFSDYSTKVLFRLCDYCRQLLFLPYVKWSTRILA